MPGADTCWLGRAGPPVPRRTQFSIKHAQYAACEAPDRHSTKPTACVVEPSFVFRRYIKKDEAIWLLDVHILWKSENQRVRQWRSGRGMENGQELFTLANFTRYGSKDKICTSFPCGNLQKSVIERGVLFGGI